VACNFTTNRMMEDYCIQYYQPQFDRYNMLAADDNLKAKELAAWKSGVAEAWPNLKVLSRTTPNASYVLSPSKMLESEVVLDLAGLSPEDIGVEIIFATSDKKGELHIQEKFDYSLAKFEDGVATFKVYVLPERTGMYQVGTRIYAKNALLPHRQDFPLVKWL